MLPIRYDVIKSPCNIEGIEHYKHVIGCKGFKRKTPSNFDFSLQGVKHKGWSHSARKDLKIA